MKISHSARFLDDSHSPSPPSPAINEHPNSPDISTSKVEEEAGATPPPANLDLVADQPEHGSMAAQTPDSQPIECSLCDRSHIRAPACFDPAGFGPHGRHVAMTAHSMFGETMYAILALDIGADDHLLSPNINDLSNTPSLKVAMDGPKQDKWLAAIKKELQSIKDEKVYMLVNPSNERIENLLGNKLVLRRKHGLTSVGRKTVCYTAHPYSADVGPPGRAHSFIPFLNIFEP